MSIGCLGILLGAISGAGAIRDSGGTLGALDDLLTELEHDFSSLEVHVKSGNTDLQTTRLHGQVSWLQKKRQSRSKGKNDVEEIKEFESPSVDDPSGSQGKKDVEEINEIESPRVNDEEINKDESPSVNDEEISKVESPRVADEEINNQFDERESPSVDDEETDKVESPRVADEEINNDFDESGAGGRMKPHEDDEEIDVESPRVADEEINNDFDEMGAGGRMKPHEADEDDGSAPPSSVWSQYQSPLWHKLRHFDQGRWRALMQSDQGIRLLQELLAWDREGGSATLPAWVPLLEKNPSKGIELFQNLIEHEERNVRSASATSPAWVPLLEKNPSKGTELFQKLIGDKDEDVRSASATSPAWVPLLEKDPSKGTELLQKLIGDRFGKVRRASATSPAWVPLLKADRSKWIQSLRNLPSPALAKDVCETMSKRQDTSMNRYFQNFSTVELLEAAQLLPEADADCLAWLGFTGALTERVLKSANSSFLSKLLEVKLWAKLAATRLVDLAEEQKQLAQLQRDAAEKQKKAAEAAAEQIQEEKKKVEEEGKKALKAEKEAQLQRDFAEEEREKALKAEKEAEKKRHLAEKAKESAETQRKKAVAAAEEIDKQKMKVEGERARALKAEKEAEERRHLAEKEKKSAEKAKESAVENLQRALTAEEEGDKKKKEREIAVMLVIALLALGTLIVFSGILWYFYPAICQWRDEKALAAEAKAAIREAETYTVNISTAPEPPSHLDIFHLHLRVYANPYILHKYDLLEPVLRQAFRISQEVLAEGLRGWDFTAVRAVQRLALGGGQNLAAEAYEMARKHIEEHDLNDLHTLTQLCQQFRQSCDQYSSQLEEVSDSVEKSFKMYLQVFKAKRDFFDTLILRIADTTGAEAQLCGEKGLLRLAEKNALRPTAGLIWDPIRAMLVGHSIGELIEVLNCLRGEAELGTIKLLQVNNRFERPTSDNWQDVAIYIQFTDERFNDIVAEIQLVHQAFLAVRTKFKAHDAYDNFRFAAEALKVKEQAEIPGLPDSQRTPPPQ